MPACAIERERAFQVGSRAGPVVVQGPQAAPRRIASREPRRERDCFLIQHDEHIRQAAVELLRPEMRTDRGVDQLGNASTIATVMPAPPEDGRL